MEKDLLKTLTCQTFEKWDFIPRIILLLSLFKEQRFYDSSLFQEPEHGNMHGCSKKVPRVFEFGCREGSLLLRHDKKAHRLGAHCCFGVHLSQGCLEGRSCRVCCAFPAVIGSILASSGAPQRACPHSRGAEGHLSRTFYHLPVSRKPKVSWTSPGLTFHS